MFRWEQLEEGTWLGVDGPNWYVIRSGPRLRIESNAPEEAFRRFFRLEVRLAEVEGKILECGPELAPYVAQLPGLRLLRPYDPEEVLFSFLCTPNNNLERITRMVRSLAAFGEALGVVAGRTIHRFPRLERIALIPESVLRDRGFGYRARTIPAVARQLLSRPTGWLRSLSEVSYERAHAELCSIQGVGPKLADCVCLFGLNHLEAAPVDTHLWQAARRLYFPEWEGRSLTDLKYREVGSFLRRRFGHLTGWAHQYLFYANLLGRRRQEGFE